MKLNKYLSRLIVMALWLSACGVQESPNLVEDPGVAPSATIEEELPAEINGEVKPGYPPERGFSQLQLHPPSGKMILFGGESNQRSSYSDTWEYDPATNEWVEVLSDFHPEGLGGVSSAYDAESDKFIFYFSVLLDSGAPKGLVAISETWAYDFTTRTWEYLEPDTHPEGLMGPRMAYDAESDRVILFGGADFTADETITYTETWAYDYNTNTWQQMNPGETPIGRSHFGIAYADSVDRVFVFGGRVQDQDIDREYELWGYDYNSDTWEQVEASGDVNPNHHPYMVYDPSTNQLLYFVKDQLTAYDIESKTWQVLGSGPSFLVVYFHAMALDPSGDLLLFGGGPAGLTYNNRFYQFAMESLDWQQIGP